MKLAILLFSVVITGMITFSAAADKNISGTWVIQTGDSICAKIILRIQRGEGIWQGRMDIPWQEVYDKKIYSAIVSGDSVFITVFKNGSTIKARMINDSTITGTLQLEGRQDAVKLKKI